MPHPLLLAMEVTEALSDLMSATEEMCLEQGRIFDEPPASLQKLVKAEREVVAAWGEYQKSLNPEQWETAQKRLLTGREGSSAL